MGEYGRAKLDGQIEFVNLERFRFRIAFPNFPDCSGNGGN